MNKKNIIPQQAQPVVRVTQGTQVDPLTELSEENLSSIPGVGASMSTDKMSLACFCACSHDGDDAE